MLAELAVSNLGVIEDLSLVLDPGMTALTGETGAGKTMLVGAIGLHAGDRADPAVVRPGADEATVQGRFLVADDEVVLTRVVPRDGRSRAYRDGRLVTAAELAELAAELVELHAQHAHVGLLTTAAQRRALDTWAGVDLAPLDAARHAVRAAERALEALGGDPTERAREVELLRHQVAEIEAAGLTDPDEDDRLAAEEALLADADAHRAAAASALEALDTDGGGREGVARALAALHDRAPFTAAAERLQGLAAELDDVARDLRDLGEAIDGDPARLAAVQARRADLADLRRRYGGQPRASLADVFEVQARLQERLAALEGHAAGAAQLDAERARALGELERAAAAVGAQRRRAAAGLAEAVEARLADLALAKARLQVVVGETDPGDEVTFLVALNPGLPAAPLAKAASGGELARTMLALRLVVAAGVPTMVFDEVDAGVGGAAARSVGRALAALAADRQVLVVTHLPQVAAFADAQVALSKQERGDTTVMHAEPLTAAARTRELARMLSGLADSDSGHEHAEELLATAAAERGR
mgnify:CR=1 FL=1